MVASTSPKQSQRLDLSIPEIEEMNVSGKVKDYPSITDYYKAASTGNKPIQYQHGLSNYSSVQLGDDRVSFKKSMSQDAYRLDTERAERMAVSDVVPSEKTKKQRREDYAEANSVVGHDKIHAMEQMMRDKLQQRTKTGPFQLRKTFKYFDRDGSGGIDFSEFQRAMELMGFQFTEMQQLALFARYDGSCTGEVDYYDFVEKLMESDFKGVASSTQKMSLNTMVSSAFADGSCSDATEKSEEGDGDSDMDEEEREQYKREEVKRLFDLVDKDGSKYIERSEVEVLLLALGREFTPEEIEKGFNKIDADSSGTINFEEFYSWYNSVAG